MNIAAAADSKDERRDRYMIIDIKNRLHGIISLLLILTAVGYGAREISYDSGGWAAAYLILTALLIPAVIYSYCAKCPCREHSCGHILPGLITKYLPQREQSPYNKYEYAVVGVSFGLMICIPLLWLADRGESVVVYAALYAASFAEIRLWVCPACENKNCPLNRVDDLA